MKSSCKESNKNGKSIEKKEAQIELRKAYHAVFVEFLESKAKKLRLLPISGALFAGKFIDQMTGLTPQAVANGFMKLSTEDRQRVLKANSIEMCIFKQDEQASSDLHPNPSSRIPQARSQLVFECPGFSKFL